MKKCVLGKPHYLWVGGGGAGRGNRHNSYESPYFRLIFFRTYYLAPIKESEMIDRLKFFAPLEGASKIFCPPFVTRLKFFALPLDQKLCFRNIEKKMIKSKILRPPFGGSPKFCAPPSGSV